MTKHITILGKLPSKFLADFSDPQNEIWSMNLHDDEFLIPRVDVWFDLHRQPKKESANLTIKNFPFEECHKLVKGRRFCSTAAYLIAYAIGFLAVINVDNVALKLFLFDIIATIVIYLLSLTIKNSSLYDAYWSLTPFVMVTYLLIKNINNLNIYHYLTYIVFSIWSIRLTINWIITFENIKWVDWRYKQLQESNNPFVWQIINLFGIMMMPTLLVFAGFYPLIVVFNN